MMPIRRCPRLVSNSATSSSAARASLRTIGHLREVACGGAPAGHLHGAVQQDHPCSAGAGLAQTWRHRRGRHHDHPVHLAACQQAGQVVVLPIRVLVAVAQHQRVGLLGGGSLYLACQFGEERVRHVTDDQADGAGRIGAQRTGADVRSIAHLPRGLLDFCPGGRRDAGTAGQRQRDGGSGYAHLSRDVLRAHRHPTSSCLID